MNKTELIAAVAAKAGLTKADAHKAVDAFVATTAAELKKGGKLTLIGFGTFSVTKRAKRTGLNPRTKAKITIPARKVAKFKASKNLVK
ncbi:MAG: HU family DNA-binding protein [Bacteroidales bacterium]|jgi:DNA-binding protein HU-beta|nr:HU family DNA-binding protein [Bacteroidales bacterium]